MKKKTIGKHFILKKYIYKKRIFYCNKNMASKKKKKVKLVKYAILELYADIERKHDILCYLQIFLQN